MTVRLSNSYPICLCTMFGLGYNGGARVCDGSTSFKSITSVYTSVYTHNHRYPICPCTLLGLGSRGGGEGARVFYGSWRNKAKAHMKPFPNTYRMCIGIDSSSGAEKKIDSNKDEIYRHYWYVALCVEIYEIDALISNWKKLKKARKRGKWTKKTQCSDSLYSPF